MQNRWGQFDRLMSPAFLLINHASQDHLPHHPFKEIVLFAPPPVLHALLGNIIAP